MHLILLTSCIASVAGDVRVLQESGDVSVQDLLSQLQATQDQLDSLSVATTTIWLIICGALVMFMQAGFAMLEAGTVRSKNTQNILLKNLVDVCAGTLAWWSVGWAVAYGYRMKFSNDAGTIVSSPDTGSDFSGGYGFFGMGFFRYCTALDELQNCVGPDAPVPNVDGFFNFRDWFFQWAFCATASTIVSGGVAERVQSTSYFVFSFIMSAFIYPVVVAWTWSGNGWLSRSQDFNASYYDFAGSGIVHMVGGIGALVGAVVLGPRVGRFSPDFDQSDFHPHSVPLVVLGTFILWFGWFGFNPGSTLAMASDSDARSAGIAAMNTVLAGATGGFALFLIRFFFMGNKYDVCGICNGILAGLVSITAPCANVTSVSAFCIGLVGAIVYQAASLALVRLRIDDPIDAFAVHGACGFWGVISAPLFDFASGFSYFSVVTEFDAATQTWSSANDAGEQLGVQILGLVAIIGWVAGCSSILFLGMNYFKILRVDAATEESGMDAAKHFPHSCYTITVRPKTSASEGSIQKLVSETADVSREISEHAVPVQVS